MHLFPCVVREGSLVTHSTAICDSIAAIPPYSALRAALTCDTPPPPKTFNIILRYPQRGGIARYPAIPRKRRCDRYSYTLLSAFLKHAFREVTSGFCKGTVPGAPPRPSPGPLRMPKIIQKRRARYHPRGTSLGEEHVK